MTGVRGQRRRKVVCVVGTRPEAIKMAPVILALRRRGWANVHVLGTAQHRTLLDQAFAAFGITMDADLNAMRPNQRLADLTARLLESLDEYLAADPPDLVLTQGDTTTVLSTALACFYLGISLGHVEAGLRTFDFRYPFPEEFNRVVTTRTATLHFAPTETARCNLEREGVPAEAIFVTGNTVIDALLSMRDRRPALPFQLPPQACIVLLTAHRRENFGEPLAGVFQAVLDLLARFPMLHVVYPVHPNPNVAGAARAMLGAEPRVHLCEPLDYPELVAVLDRATLVLTDSGGLQEEAPALAKPVLVLRNETERPEAVEAGVAKLIGTDRVTIFREVERLLASDDAYRQMARGVSPYGDGLAAQRICDAVESYLGVDVETRALPPTPE